MNCLFPCCRCWLYFVASNARKAGSRRVALPTFSLCQRNLVDKHTGFMRPCWNFVQPAACLSVPSSWVYWFTWKQRFWWLYMSLSSCDVLFSIHVWYGCILVTHLSLLIIYLCKCFYSIWLSLVCILRSNLFAKSTSTLWMTFRFLELKVKA